MTKKYMIMAKEVSNKESQILVVLRNSKLHFVHVARVLFGLSDYDTKYTYR